MPIVNGTLTDFGLDPLTLNSPVLVFRASSTGLAGLNLLSSRKAVEVAPAENGYFEADLVATTLIAPETTHYTVEIRYRETATGMRISELLPWKLLVPPEGGTLGDLLRVPANPALVWTGTVAPIEPSPGTWWLNPDTGDLQELDGDGETWLYKANLRGPAGYNATGAAEDDAAIAAFITAAAGGTATSAALAGTKPSKAVASIGEFLTNYPRAQGETEDGPRLRRAIAAAVAAGTRTVWLGAGTLTLNTKTTIADAEIRLIGDGLNTNLTNGNNTTMIDVTGAGFVMQYLKISATDVARTNFSVTVTGGVRPLFDTIYVAGGDGSNRCGIHFVSGSMGTVQNSILSHGCIKISTWDVKIDKVYVWAMSCEFGIGIYNGAGNTTLTNIDVVPPLVSTANGLAGIYVDGVSGKPFNTKMSNIYLDGNPTLDTRMGIYIGDGAGATILHNINANRMDSDCIVIDSAFNLILDGYSGHTNNDKGRGSREIYITKTGNQSVENIRLRNIQCLRTSAVVGTAAPAIEVNPIVDGSQISIEFDIKQPGAGGGYSVPEVKADHTKTTLIGKGHLSKYSSRGSAAFAAGAAGVTVNLSTPYPMAYRPLFSDIRLQFDVGLPSAPRIQFTSDNQIYVSWSGTAAAAGNVYWSVDFRR